MDPNIAKLIERTRARRNEMKETGPTQSEYSPLPSEKRNERSPLKSRNFESSPTKSPLKGTAKTVQFGKSPSKAKSPKKSLERSESSCSDEVKELLRRKSLETSVQELISRDSPGKTVTTKTTSSSSYSPGKTTITKTVVTEKQELYEKTESVKVVGNRDFLSALDSETRGKLKMIAEQEGDMVTQSFTKDTKEAESSPKQYRQTKTVPIVDKGKDDFSDYSCNQEANDYKTESLNTRKARLANLARKFNDWEDDTNHSKTNPTERSRSPLKQDGYRSRSPTKQASPPRHDPLQFINSQNNTSPPKTVKQINKPVVVTKDAPVVKVKNRDSLVTSLKAQGFQETESRSKLVYDFEQEKEDKAHDDFEPEKEGRSQSPSPTRSPVRNNPFILGDKNKNGQLRGRSPTKKQTHENEPTERGRSPTKKQAEYSRSPMRQVSPLKHNPMQFITPQSQSTSPTKHGERGRSPVKSVRTVSPTKMDIPPRSISPSKPHPLQFINPSIARAVSPVKNPSSSIVPPKPSRTYETTVQSQQKPKTWRTEAQIQVQEQQPEEAFLAPTGRFVSEQVDVRVDSPMMKSISQKRDMFEQNKTPEPEKVDPAFMSMSERKALFQKNASIPTPIARFGDPVTPAMLSKRDNMDGAQGTPLSRPPPVRPGSVFAKKPIELPTTESAQDSAWKRKREQSPQRRAPSPSKFATPQPQTTRVPPVPASAPAPSTRVTSVQDQTGTPNVGRKTNEIHKRLFENQNKDWKDNTIAKQALEEKQKEMDVLLNRYQHLRDVNQGESSTDPAAETGPTSHTYSSYPEEVPLPPPQPPSPEKYYPGVSSMKRVKVSPPKPGGMYPPLDFESSSGSSTLESRISADDLNMSVESEAMSMASEAASMAPSLGAHIAAMAQDHAAHQDSQLDTIHEADFSRTSMDTDDGDILSESAVCNEIDDMLDEAMDDSVEEEDAGPTPPKVSKISSSSSGGDSPQRGHTKSSWEFHTPRGVTSTKNRNEEKFKTPKIVTSDSPVSRSPGVQLEGEEGPLLHTVSFFRKQKPASIPVTRIVRDPKLEATAHSAPPESPRATIQQKIKVLQDDANSQMSVISQASQALNLCRSTKEFYGSAEQVEGERLLLVASHKRTAAMSEIQRLKTEGGIGREEGGDQDHVRGTVSLSGVSLGLKREFVEQLKSGDNDFVHHFVCLVKCGGQVIPTQMVSTVDGLAGAELNFPNLINLRDLSKGFEIQLEVYGLQTRREILQHEEKYHIRKEKSLFHLTPKLKMNKQESRLTRPSVSSPGGPQAVRTSSFAMVGNSIITMDSIQRKDHNLEKVPAVSPLEGSIRFKLTVTSESQVTERGFLTMFDDVSGFGAWHRRWFHLSGNTLAYWKYPDDENKQAPMGSIDLGRLVTESVELCPRDICSRMHTMLLETSRPAKKDDQESLIVVRQGPNTIIRHLLSADSREERLSWSHVLNQAISNLRAWDPQYRPRGNSMCSVDTVSTVSDLDAVSSCSTEIW